MHQREVDTLIIGAGVIGSSVAMHLAEMGAENISVLDPDLEGTWSSSERNAGAVRATMVQPVNIQLAKTSIEYYEKEAEAVGYRPVGYLWLHSREKVPGAAAALEEQRRQGWPVEEWDLKQLQSNVPFLDKTDGIAAIHFAPRDGLLNPNLLKNHYRDRAKKKGVAFLDRHWIQRADFEMGRWNLHAILLPTVLMEEEKETFFTQGVSGARETVAIRTARVVNCVGPWAADLAKLFGYNTPAKPVRRQVSIFDSREVDLSSYGMIVDTSGVYFHPEATHGLAGFVDPEEPDGKNFKYDGEDFFNEKIWMKLFERSSSFEKLRHMTGWSGLYEVSPDKSAILGEVNQKGREGRLFEAHSFSGHGVMQSYMAGKLLAEKMVHGQYQSMDGEPLSGERFGKGQLVNEEYVL